MTLTFNEISRYNNQLQMQFLVGMSAGDVVDGIGVLD